MSVQLAADLGLSTLRRLTYTADGALTVEPQIATLDASSASVVATLAAPGEGMIGKEIQVSASSIANTASLAFTGPGGATTTITFAQVDDVLKLRALTASVWSIEKAPAASALTQTYSTADATHAARTASALTDNSGGGSADGTIAVVTAPMALTDSSGGSAGATLAAITNAANTGSADVGPTANVCASLAARQAENRAAIVALTDAIKELSTAINAVRVDQVDAASFVNSLVDKLQAAGVVL